MTMRELARTKVLTAVEEVRDYESYRDGDVFDKFDIIEQYINEDFTVYENVCRELFEEIEDFNVFEALNYITEVFGGHNIKSYEDLYNSFTYCYIVNEGVISEILDELEEENGEDY